MTIRQIAVAAGLGLASLAAQALVLAGTVGNVTTYTESFNGGSSFSAGWFDATGTDDYLQLLGATDHASFSFSSAVPLQSATVSFWYQVPDAGNATVALAGVGPLALPSTPGLATKERAFNPGAGTLASASFSITADHLSAGTYTITFATTGPTKVLRVDDVVITTVSVVPEPGTLALMLSGVGVLGWLSKRRRIG